MNVLRDEAEAHTAELSICTLFYLLIPVKDNHLQKSERDRMQSCPRQSSVRRFSCTEEEVDRKALHSSKAGAFYLHIPKHSREIVGAGAEVEVVENIFLHGCYVWI